MKHIIIFLVMIGLSQKVRAFNIDSLKSHLHKIKMTDANINFEAKEDTVSIWYNEKNNTINLVNGKLISIQSFNDSNLQDGYQISFEWKNYGIWPMEVVSYYRSGELLSNWDSNTNQINVDQIKQDSISSNSLSFINDSIHGGSTLSISYYGPVHIAKVTNRSNNSNGFFMMFENGKLRIIGLTNKRNLLDGLCYVYDDNANLQYIFNIQDGLLDGVQIIYINKHSFSLSYEMGDFLNADKGLYKKKVARRARNSYNITEYNEIEIELVSHLFAEILEPQDLKFK